MDGRTRVILVDDTVELRSLIRIALERCGDFEVVAEAGDGAAGVELTTIHRPDLVLLDLAMPVMDGLQAIPLIRSASPDSVIVVLSGFDAASMRQQVLELGAHGYLVKGISVTEMVSTLRDLVPGGRARASPDPTARPGTAQIGLLDMAAHELRRPLAVIHGFLTLLEDGSLGQLNASGVQLLPGLLVRAREMDSILSEILDSARLDQGTLRLELQDFDLREVLGEILQKYRPLIEPGHRLRVVIPPGAATVHGDRGRISTVVANLVDNAIKFSPAGGEVDCRLEVDPHHTTLTVTDEGIGIPDSERSLLFSKFGRLPSGSHVFGTGLGLFISRELARMHGGDIRVNSEAGAGSRFELSLPVESAPDHV